MSKGPGKDAQGHKPGSKVKLEGPKRHHDDHGEDASRPMKGDGPAVPTGAWEKSYSLNNTRNTKSVVGAEFNPQRPGSRLTTYPKVNKDDH